MNRPDAWFYALSYLAALALAFAVGALTAAIVALYELNKRSRFHPPWRYRERIRNEHTSGPER